jgi:hypothetical protein
LPSFLPPVAGSCSAFHFPPVSISSCGQVPRQPVFIFGCSDPLFFGFTVTGFPRSAAPPIAAVYHSPASVSTGRVSRAHSIRPLRRSAVAALPVELLPIPTSRTSFWRLFFVELTVFPLDFPAPIWFQLPPGVGLSHHRSRFQAREP